MSSPFFKFFLIKRKYTPTLMKTLQIYSIQIKQNMSKSNDNNKLCKARRATFL